MTFYQARVYARAGLHIRRSVWEDHWFSCWRGMWFYQTGDELARPVETTDYTTNDLNANDWTTIPAPLEAHCEIPDNTPEIPTTDPTQPGGGVPPGPILGPGAPPNPDNPGGGPGISITPPGPTTTVSRVCRVPPRTVLASVNGVHSDPPHANYGSPNGTHSLVWNPLEGEWQHSFTSGTIDGINTNYWLVASHCGSTGPGIYYCRVISLVGPVGGGHAPLGAPITLDLGTHHTDGQVVLS
jgi:hypothetical protein